MISQLREQKVGHLNLEAKFQFYHVSELSR